MRYLWWPSDKFGVAQTGGWPEWGALTYDADHEAWLFGLSRGAYTVRCVAGMINNCGILHRQTSEEQTGRLCDEVYRIYRSKLEANEPHSKQSIVFRQRKS